MTYKLTFCTLIVPFFDFFHRMTPLTHAGTKTAGLILKNFASLPASVALIFQTRGSS